MDSNAADGRGTETEYLLMRDFLGRSGIIGSDSHRLPHGTTEAQAIAQAEALLEAAGRVEIWTREVPVEWTKVDEFTR